MDCVEPLQAIETSALRAVLDLQPTTPAKIAFAFRMAAGAALGRAGTPVWSSDGTLYVRAQSDAWRTELRHAAPILLARLRDLVGQDVVRRIDIS